MKTEKKKLQGSALFTVVSVMAILILFLTGTLALATASNNRAHKSYAISQADYTARAAISSLKAAVQDNSTNGINLRAAMSSLAESPNADLVFRPTLTLSDSTMGNVGYWDPDSDPANPEWIFNAITLSHVPNQFEYVYNETTGQWDAWRVIMATATCRVGREEETVNAFISIEPGGSTTNPDTIVHHQDGYWTKAGGGSEVKGLQEAGGADFQNGGNIYGGLGVNLSAGGSGDLIVLDNQFKTYSPLNFINGNSYHKTSSFQILVEDNAGAMPPSATVITGSFIGKNNSFITVNYKMPAGYNYSNKDIPYFYVNGVLASPTGSDFKLVQGNGSPYNVFAGTLYCPEQFIAQADLYLMDKPSENTYDEIDTGDPSGWDSVANKAVTLKMPAVKYGHNVLGRKDGPSGRQLYNWAADTVNRRNDDYGFGGSIYCNGDLEIWNATIEGDVRVKGKLSINGSSTKIKGDIVVENAYENAGKTGDARTSGLTWGEGATESSIRQGYSAAEIGHIYSIKSGAAQVITRMKEGYKEADGIYPKCAKVKNLKLENIPINDAQVEEGKYMYGGKEYNSQPYLLVEPTKTEYAEGETAPAADPAVVVTDQFSYFQLAKDGTLLKVDDKPVVTYSEYTCYDEDGNETDEESISGKHYLDAEGNRVTRYSDAFDIVFDPSNPDTYDVASYPYEVYPDELTREKIYGVGETNASNKTKLITTLTDVRKGLNMDIKTGYFDEKIYTRMNPYDALIAAETDPDQKEMLQQKKADHTLTGTLSSKKVITRPKDGAEWYILKDYTISGDNARLLIADNAETGAATRTNGKYTGGIIRFYVEGKLTIDNRSYISTVAMSDKLDSNQDYPVSYKDDYGIEYYSGGYVYDENDPTKKDINPTPGGRIEIHNNSMIVGSIKAPYLKLNTNNSDGKSKWPVTYTSEKGEVSNFYPTLIGNALVEKLTEAQNGFNLCFTKSGSGSSGAEGEEGRLWVDTSWDETVPGETVPTPGGIYRFTYYS